MFGGALAADQAPALNSSYFSGKSLFKPKSI